MAFTGNYSCNTLRSGLINGSFDFSTDTFYMALYTNLASLNQTTTEYTSVGEVVASGYTAGGQIITATVNTSETPSGSVTYVNFSSPSWTAAFTARGALIYKAGANGAVCVLDFGNDKTSTTTFTVQMPQNTSTAALIRLI
jgi:hypothetical protein